MRHLVWLSGILLALSCSVNDDNLGLDPGGTGGISSIPADGGRASGGTSGGSPTGGTGGALATGGTSGAGAVAPGGAGGTLATGGTGGGATGSAGGSTATGGNTGAGGVTAGTGGSTATGGTSGSAGGGGGTAGRSGTGGQGGTTSCAALETAYMTALTQAKNCTVGAANQCEELVAGSLSCPGCRLYVNDSTTLQTIAGAWTDQGCGSYPHACPAIACVLPTAGRCVAGDTGIDRTGTCSAGPATLGAN